MSANFAPKHNSNPEQSWDLGGFASLCCLQHSPQDPGPDSEPWAQVWKEAQTE